MNSPSARPPDPSVVDSPGFAVLLALLAIVIGLFGSAYQGEIASAFPLRLEGPWDGVSAPALVFWAALLMLGWGLYLRQHADDAARAGLQDATRRIDVATRNIETSVQTLPGRAFLDQVSEAVARSR